MSYYEYNCEAIELRNIFVRRLGARPGNSDDECKVTQGDVEKMSFLSGPGLKKCQYSRKIYLYN